MPKRIQRKRGLAEARLPQLRNDRGEGETMTPRTACERIASKVMTTEDWLAKHRDHGDLTTEPFPHPSGEWHTLVCECGAKHTTAKETK